MTLFCIKTFTYEIKNNDLIIIQICFLVCFEKPIENVAIEYDNRVANAEPVIPIMGIKMKFKMIFDTVPKAVLKKESLVKFSLIKY